MPCNQDGVYNVRMKRRWRVPFSSVVVTKITLTTDRRDTVNTVLVTRISTHPPHFAQLPDIAVAEFDLQNNFQTKRNASHGLLDSNIMTTISMAVIWMHASDVDERNQNGKVTFKSVDRRKTP